MFDEKQQLFNKLKDQGLFWSYAADAGLHDVGERALVETCFRYADWPDLCQMFRIFEREQLFEIWQQDIKPDLRFKKQNLLIARVLFGLDVETDYFQDVDYARNKKLRLLAG